MNKVKIDLYVTARSVTERLPRQGGKLARHNYEHPDAEIRIWSVGKSSLAGRQDQIRHAVMVALQSAGLSVNALRDTGGGVKPKAKQVSKRQQTLL